MDTPRYTRAQHAHTSYHHPQQGEEVRVTSLSLHQVNFTQPTHSGHSPKRSLVTLISGRLSYAVRVYTFSARSHPRRGRQLPVNRDPPIFARYFVLRGRRKKTARPIGRRRTDADRPAIIDPLFIQETPRARAIDRSVARPDYPIRGETSRIRFRREEFRAFARQSRSLNCTTRSGIDGYALARKK